MDDKKAKEIVVNNFLKYLDRLPGEEGLHHFVPLLKNNVLDELTFVKEIKNSIEYRGRINLANMKNPWKSERFGSVRQKIHEITAPFRTLPNFLVIGAPRCGTTALYDYLAQHPKIMNTRYKELHFFSKYYYRGKNWYRSFFPLSNKQGLTGEATPTYLHYPHAPKRVHQLIPDIKLIVLLRNPIDRAYSHHQYRFLRSTGEKLTFEESFELDNKPDSEVMRKMIVDENYYSEKFYNQNYFSLGVYWKQLERWFEYFPKDKFLIIKSENFFSDTKAVMTQIYDFLGLPPHYLKSYVKIHSSGTNKNIDSRFRNVLSEYYMPHNEKLYKLIDQDFSW